MPLVGDTGPLPADRCTVSHTGQTGSANVHLGPGKQFALVARLDRNRWAEGLQVQAGWYEIRIGPGQTGWVEATVVAANDFCPAPEPVPATAEPLSTSTPEPPPTGPSNQGRTR